MKLFQPTQVALININHTIYTYYENNNNELSLIEETPTLKLVNEIIENKVEVKVENYPYVHTVQILPILSIKFRLPKDVLSQRIEFKIRNNIINVDELYKKGGESIIYKGRFNGYPVILRMIGRFGKKLRALPPILRSYQPDKYLVFKEFTGKYVVVMQILKEIIYSEKIYQQAMDFLNILESLNEIHGDISPGNVMMDDDGNIKFIDFNRYLGGGTPFYSKGNTDRQALARVLLGLKYSDIIRTYINSLGFTFQRYNLGNLYSIYSWPNETEFFNWFQTNFPQDHTSLKLIEMAK